MTLTVEVDAPDEETAIMRAGMKRADMFRLGTYYFPAASRNGEWEKLDVQPER